jgi:structural maintenance of chromosome 2
LKEGMFTNANRVFRTRFQEGTSTISVMWFYQQKIYIYI